MEGIHYLRDFCLTFSKNNEIEAEISEIARALKNFVNGKKTLAIRCGMTY